MFRSSFNVLLDRLLLHHKAPTSRLDALDAAIGCEVEDELVKCLTTMHGRVDVEPGQARRGLRLSGRAGLIATWLNVEDGSEAYA